MTQNKKTIHGHTGAGKTTNTKAASASGGVDGNGQSASPDDVRLCAYRKWESAGKPNGDGVQFWLEAECDLAQGK